MWLPSVGLDLHSRAKQARIERWISVTESAVFPRQNESVIEPAIAPVGDEEDDEGEDGGFEGEEEDKQSSSGSSASDASSNSDEDDWSEAEGSGHKSKKKASSTNDVAPTSTFTANATALPQADHSATSSAGTIEAQSSSSGQLSTCVDRFITILVTAVITLLLVALVMVLKRRLKAHRRRKRGLSPTQQSKEQKPPSADPELAEKAAAPPARRYSHDDEDEATSTWDGGGGEEGDRATESSASFPTGILNRPAPAVISSDTSTVREGRLGLVRQSLLRDYRAMQQLDRMEMMRRARRVSRAA